MSAHDDEFPANERIHVMNVHRRACLDHLTPLEVAAFELIRACEIAGAHPLLTEAQSLAIKAKDVLADWIDADMPGSNQAPWGNASELIKPGEWNPMRFDPDYPRPWITKPSAEPADVHEGKCRICGTIKLLNGDDRCCECYSSRPRITGAEPEPALSTKNWRILTCDASWISVSGTELRRDDDWIEIVGHGTQHCFHRPQSVEQIGQSA